MSLYIACDTLNFSWRKHHIAKVESMWQEGADIRDIAEAVKRDVDEVAILIIDRARCGRIEKRANGVYG